MTCLHPSLPNSINTYIHISIFAGKTLASPGGYWVPPGMGPILFTLPIAKQTRHRHIYIHIYIYIYIYAAPLYTCIYIYILYICRPPWASSVLDYSRNPPIPPINLLQACKPTLQASKPRSSKPPGSRLANCCIRGRVRCQTVVSRWQHTKGKPFYKTIDPGGFGLNHGVAPTVGVIFYLDSWKSMNIFENH